MSGAYGRRAPSNRPALSGSSFMRMDAVIPSPLNDYLSRLTGWEMLGNDSAGDCVPVTWSNFRRLVTALLAGHEVYPSQDQVWELYRTQNPGFDPNGTADTNGPGSGHDQGMDIQTVLEYLVKTGGPDGVKAVAFAKLTGEAEIRQAQSIFGGVWLGINVLQANETEFDNGQPWDYVPDSPDAGGHSILGGGHQDQAADDLRFITWATETTFTEAFVKHQLEEAWLVIWPEHLGTEQFIAGVDLAALATYYTELTGRPFPVAIPPEPVPPTPEPTPPTPVPPVPDPTPPGAASFLGEDPRVAERVTQAAARLRLTETDWMNKHFQHYFRIA